MINVLHFWEYYIPGLNVDLHSIFLKRKDIKSNVVAEKIHFRTLTREYYKGVEYFTENNSNINMKMINELFYKRILGNIYRKRLERFIEKSIVKNKPDILHAHFGTAGCKLINLKMRFNLPLLVSYFGNDISYCLKIPRLVDSYKELFKVVDCCQVLCEEAKQRILSIGCPEEKIRLFNCILNVSDYEYSARKMDGDRVRFIIAARFVEKKGYPYLIEAFSNILNKGYDVTLTIIGYGPLKDEILKDIKRHKLIERVRLIDTSNVDKFEVLYSNELKNHDIFIMPSVTASNGDDEGGPAMTLIYAQSAGLPVIATHFPGSERSVFEGETGIYCKERDSLSLQEKMEYLINHKELWNILGKKANCYVQQNFSLEGEVEKTIALYNDLIKRRSLMINY